MILYIPDMDDLFCSKTISDELKKNNIDATVILASKKIILVRETDADRAIKIIISLGFSVEK